MKKIIISLVSFLMVCAVAAPVMAAPNLGTGDNSLVKTIGTVAQYNTSVDEYTLSETVGRAIKIILTLVGTIFFSLAVYAGFLWMTARGNGDQVEKAQGIFRTATIGMIVIIASYSITALVMLFVARSTGT